MTGPCPALSPLWPPSLRVLEGEGQFGACELLEAFAQEADQLRLEDGLQEIVGIILVEDEEVVLPGAGGATTGVSPTTAGASCAGGNLGTLLGLGTLQGNMEGDLAGRLPGFCNAPMGSLLLRAGCPHG